LYGLYNGENKINLQDYIKIRLYVSFLFTTSVSASAVNVFGYGGRSVRYYTIYLLAIYM